jgi:tripartite-type tricarboxylate transporter receptor subunit TctC
MDISRRLLLSGALHLAGGALCAGGVERAWAEGAANYPNRRLRMIAPFAAGGQADVLCRKIGASMGAVWNQAIVVENRTGAGGLIGAEVISKSTPDGYTLGVIVPGVLIQGILDKKTSFDVTRDLTPISCVVQNPKCIVVNADVPARKLQDLIDLVRKDPARYGSYGTSGFGSRAHLAMALINDMAKTKFVHVPYRGGSAVIPDLLGGQLPVGVLDLGSIFSQLDSGKIRVIAVTGLTRSATLPDVPAVAETFPGFHAEEWYALVAPAGMPADILDKIYGEVQRWKASADAASYSKSFGADLVADTPADFGKFLASENEYLTKVVAQLNIKMDADQ